MYVCMYGKEEAANPGPLGKVDKKAEPLRESKGLREYIISKNPSYRETSSSRMDVEEDAAMRQNK